MNDRDSYPELTLTRSTGTGQRYLAIRAYTSFVAIVGERIEVDEAPSFPQLHDRGRGKVLEIDATANRAMVTAVLDAMPATPCPWTHSRDPSRAATTAKPPPASG
jgi:hypothetical protein